MKTLRIASLILAAGTLSVAGLFGHAADPVKPEVQPAPSAAPLVVHEWGTFTSFSGSDGVPANFSPNSTDLPDFVYSQAGAPNSKSIRLQRDGTVSMETPVIYFYTDRELKASVKVDFPCGWITEWYPFAAMSPSPEARKIPGQSMRWDVRLLPGETVKFPGKPDDENHYFEARATDAVPLQTEVAPRENDRNFELRGGSVVQREKFLFYRGVGTFPPPVSLKATGGSSVRIHNSAGNKVEGLVLVHVEGSQVGFQVLGSLDAGTETTATIPAAAGKKADLAAAMLKLLTATGLYEKEAQAMVNTWDSAWFGESGTRLLYLVPRAKTDELLPLTITPKPTEVVRVLVGRHDFLTPEQEATADREVKRSRAARAELEAAETELRKIGRFQGQARQQAEKRIETSAARR